MRSRSDRMASRRWADGALFGSADPNCRISWSIRNISTVMIARKNARTAAPTTATLPAWIPVQPLGAVPLLARDAMTKHSEERGGRRYASNVNARSATAAIVRNLGCAGLIIQNWLKERLTIAKGALNVEPRRISTDHDLAGISRFRCRCCARLEQRDNGAGQAGLRHRRRDRFALHLRRHHHGHRGDRHG